MNYKIRTSGLGDPRYKKVVERTVRERDDLLEKQKLEYEQKIDGLAKVIDHQQQLIKQLTEEQVSMMVVIKKFADMYEVSE